jgi:UDP-3-O-[3-hydroxymyristoyl] glucosamine N-acyltransferase
MGVVMSHKRHTVGHDSTVCTAEDKSLVPEDTRFDGFIHVSDTVEILGPFYADSGCRLSQGVVIGASFGAPVILEGEVTLGSDCIIREGTEIGYNSKLGIACTIGAFVKIGRDVTFGDGVYVGDGAEIKDGVTIGTINGGTTIGNFARIESMSEIQGTLNTVNEKGAFRRIDLVEAGEVIPISNLIYVINGKRYSANLA